MTTTPTRRDFLGATAGAAAACWLGGRTYAAGAAAHPGPNEMIRLGFIGCGGRAHQLLREFQLRPDAQVAAVCDVNAAHLEEFRQAAGGAKVAAYRDYRKLLDDKSIHAVVVATPDHWHALTTIDACRAGKDVYVEKPLATSIGEGRAMVRAARKYERIVQIGTQQHSWDHYRRAVEIIQSGRLGDISEVKSWDYEQHFPGFGAPPDGDSPAELDWDFFLGPAPKVPYNRNRYEHHFFFFDYGCGWANDWGVHHHDIIHWALGVKQPLTAYAAGGNLAFDCAHDNREWPDTYSGVCEYGPSPLAKRGFLLQYTHRDGCRRDRISHGKLFCGTDGLLLLHRGGFSLLSEVHQGKPAIDDLEVKSSKAVTTVDAQGHEHLQRPENHAEVFLAHVRDRRLPPSDVEVGYHACMPGYLMNIAWKLGRKVHWDGEKEQFIDDPEANKLQDKAYRAPWTLEV